MSNPLEAPVAPEFTPNAPVTPNVPAPPAGLAVIDENQRTWGMIAHLSAFAYYISGIGIVLGPLIVWLSKGGPQHPFIEDQAKEALNFRYPLSCTSSPRS